MEQPEKPIYIPQAISLGNDCRFDRYPATRRLQDKTGAVLIFTIYMRRDAETKLYHDAALRIIHKQGHTGIASIPISNDMEANSLYHKFRKLNPEFWPCA